MSDEFVIEDTEDLLVSNLNSVEAGIIASILDAYNVPHYKKTRGTGSMMEIYAGATSNGIDIYVPSHIYQFAKEIIDKQNIEDKEIEGID